MSPPRPALLTRAQRAAAALLLAAVALLVGTARVSYVQASDPFGTLLVSKALAAHGTIRLDVLGLPDLEARLAYRGFSRGGHTYYVYPLGTSLLATPFVVAAESLGVDLREHADEVRLQHWLATLAAVGTVALLLRLSTRLLPFWPALLCTAAFWTGTSLASTGGTALWSHVAVVLLSLLAIDLVVAAELSGRRVPWLPLGLMLFLAYLTRPTALLFIVLLLAWVAWRDRVGAVRAAAVAGGMFAGFVACSWREFGELLPPYYRLGLQGGGFSSEALAGLLVSPSRGLLTFSPLLAVAWVAWPLARRDWPLAPGWWLVALAWPMLLLVALARWPMWWGGGCFGPRLLTDVLPGVFLLVLRTWPVRWPRHREWAAVAALVPVVLFSSYVHVAKGLHEPWTFRWNGEPSVDTEPWARWAWRYPQFLHDGERHRARLVAYYARQRPAPAVVPVTAGLPLTPDVPHFDVLGFDRMRPSGRWTLLPVAELLFTPAAPASMRALSLTYGSNGRQALRIELNETVLFDGVVDATEAEVRMPLPRQAWQPGLNRLRFVLPDTRRLRRGDRREYGMVVKRLRFE